MQNKRFSTRKIAAMGLLAALTAVLHYAEGLIPALPMLPPGVRLGLANIVVAYCLFYLGRREALEMAVFKSAFVLITRGVSAGCISFSGGLLALGVMILAKKWAPEGNSCYFWVSIPGAAAHNLGQLLMAAILLQNTAVFYSLPVLLAAGILMGAVTALLLRAVLPALGRISGAAETIKHSGKDEW